MHGTLTACKLRFGENNDFPLADSRHVTHQELICVRKPLMPSWRTLRLNIHASVAESWSKKPCERYFPCRNLAPAPEDNFVLCPEDYAAAEDWGTVTAIVHSHPDATTQPSELDKAQCDLMAVLAHRQLAGR
jgi:hypothetical protein